MSAITGTERIYSTVVSINPASITTYPELISGSRPHKQLETYKLNFQDNQHHTKISHSAAKKISTALDYILYTAKEKKIPEGFRGQGLKYKIAFVTLTLSSRQIHSDKEIIKGIFQPLLDWLRKSYKCESYIWRAEKQKNGNLHFHLIIDKWVPWQILRERWNRYQQNLGYVTRYADRQRKFHEHGYHVRYDLIKNWKPQNQKAAYEKSRHQDWNNPNSVDIHSTKHIKNLKQYLCKYLTKQQNENNEKDPNKFTNPIDLLSIDSRLWACSERLSNLRGAKADIDSEIIEELERVKSKKNVKTVIGDYFTVCYVDICKLDQNEFPNLIWLFENYIKEKFPDY
jgi:hypothetical protein